MKCLICQRSGWRLDVINLEGLTARFLPQRLVVR